jgi:DNA-binding transcriptional MerR regulator
MSTLDTKTYSTAEAVELVGCTYRQLDYWVRTGAVVPGFAVKGTGRPRRWTVDEIRRLKEVVAILDGAHTTVAEFYSGALWAASR